ncbi:MAG: DUF3617 domain-containing protein [Wenzhouxiangella sp.]
MLRTILVLAGLAAFSLTVQAQETPNIEPGLWEYRNKMTFQSEMPIPDQDHTNQDCVTHEDIEQGDAFLEDVDECEIDHKDLRRDAMDYAMTCTNPDGSVMTMDASMQFNGDSASGTINGEMESPMGNIAMTIEMEGRRIGECD